MSGRGLKVKCVYCKYPNHFKGIVTRYSSGERRLVGRDCALKHHGVEFEGKIIDFEAGVEHQSLMRRRRKLLAATADVFRQFEELKAHPAVITHDRLLKDWRGDFDDLAAGIAEVARRGELLAVDREVRDEAGERERKERLGNRFEEQRNKAKLARQRWQLTKASQGDHWTTKRQFVFFNWDHGRNEDWRNSDRCAAEVSVPPWRRTQGAPN